MIVEKRGRPKLNKPKLEQHSFACESELYQKAKEILYSKNITVSEYLRSSLKKVCEENNCND